MSAPSFSMWAVPKSPEHTLQTATLHTSVSCTKCWLKTSKPQAC